MRNSKAFSKYRELKSRLKKAGSVIVAFSGGADSGLLAYAAYRVLASNALAVTARSPLYPESELKEAVRAARSIGIQHRIISTRELKDTRFIRNTRNRCFWCKQELFSRIQGIRAKHGFSAVVDGTNYDDAHDFRPGRRAAARWGVMSPLYDCRLTKREIRELARHFGLRFWDKPPGTCLGSRIPFGEKLTLPRLKRAGKAEEILKDFIGKRVLFRVRDHGPVARLEFPRRMFPAVIKKRGWPGVVQQLKKTGYRFITVDIEGYIPQGQKK